MKKFIIIACLAMPLSACGFFSDEKQPASVAEKEAGAKKKPVQVPFDPAFKDIAGTWVSEPGAVAENRVLRVDIASGGGYSIDVRIPGEKEQVVEAGRGAAKSSGNNITSDPEGEIKGNVLKGLGAWKATVSEKTTMTLTGANGKTVTLSYKGL